jgi:hypothetical protein
MRGGGRESTNGQGGLWAPKHHGRDGEEWVWVGEEGREGGACNSGQRARANFYVAHEQARECCGHAGTTTGRA